MRQADEHLRQIIEDVVAGELLLIASWRSELGRRVAAAVLRRMEDDGIWLYDESGYIGHTSG